MAIVQTTGGNWVIFDTSMWLCYDCAKEVNCRLLGKIIPWAKSFRKPSIGVQTDETGYPSVSLMVELPISSSSIRHLPRLPAEQFPQTPLQEWFEALSADSPFLSPSPLRTSAFEVKFAPPLFLSSFDACCLSRRPMCPCLFWGSIYSRLGQNVGISFLVAYTRLYK